MAVWGLLVSSHARVCRLRADRDRTVCGSESMVQSSRSAVGLRTSGIGAVLKGGASVSLFVEGFGYA